MTVMSTCSAGKCSVKTARSQPQNSAPTAVLLSILCLGLHQPHICIAAASLQGYYSLSSSGNVQAGSNQGRGCVDSARGSTTLTQNACNGNSTQLFLISPSPSNSSR